MTASNSSQYTKQGLLRRHESVTCINCNKARKKCTKTINNHRLPCDNCTKKDTECVLREYNKPRGRPPGSRNKMKHGLSITAGSQPVMIVSDDVAATPIFITNTPSTSPPSFITSTPTITPPIIITPANSTNTTVTTLNANSPIISSTNTTINDFFANTSTLMTGPRYVLIPYNGQIMQVPITADMNF